MQRTFPLYPMRNYHSKAGDSMAEGFFRCKKGFTVVQNEITKDVTISLKAKGLYLVIQAYITMPDKKWTKEDFLKLTKEGRKAFDSAWKELKESGYLKVHFMPDNGNWQAEYELLDEPVSGPHTLYHDSEGNISSDNLQRAEKKRQIEDVTSEAENEEDNSRKKGIVNEEIKRYPPFGSNAKSEDDRYPLLGSNAKGSNGDGSNAKGGNNNNTLGIKPICNTYISNPNQNPDSEDRIEQYSMRCLEKLFHTNDMITMGMAEIDVEMVMEILYDTINTTKKTVWINREEKPTAVVRARLLKLKCMDIMYAVEQYHKQTTEIYHQKAYMLSILYDSRGQGHLDYTNRVQHDLYGAREEGD